MKDENRVAGETVKTRGLWKKFIHLVRLARVPWLGIVLYLIASTVSIYIAVALPQVNGDFFAGNASVENVITVIVFETELPQSHWL